MNYTKTIRQYCEMNPDTIFDVAFMSEKYIALIPYKTLLRILNRLEEDGVLLSVSKGVYYIVGNKKFDLAHAVKSFYIDNFSGMYVGYKMYSNLEVSDYEDDKIEIYTAKIASKHKSIGKYRLTRADLLFDYEIEGIIKALELIQHGLHIKDIDYERYSFIRSAMTVSYPAQAILSVIEEIPYKYSTLVTFDLELRKKGFDNKFLKAYKENHSNDANILFP